MRDKNFSKLRGAIVECGYTFSDFAVEIDLTPQGFNEKLQGRNQFTLLEIIKSCNLLDKPVDIFFEPKLYNLQFLKNDKPA